MQEVQEKAKIKTNCRCFHHMHPLNTMRCDIRKFICDFVSKNYGSD